MCFNSKTSSARAAKARDRSDGAIILGKLPVPGRPAHLVNSGT